MTYTDQLTALVTAVTFASAITALRSYILSRRDAARMAALLARVSALEEALKPMAEIGAAFVALDGATDEVWTSIGDDRQIRVGPGGWYIIAGAPGGSGCVKLADFRRAYRLLYPEST